MKCSLASIALIALSASFAQAKDLGQVETTWPIAEPDFVEAIQAKLKNMEASGELERKQKEFADRARKNFERPTVLQRVPTARESSHRYFDPSVVMTQELRDHQGTLISPAGTVVNPLHYVGLRRPILMIDGDDQDQMSLARRKMAEHDHIIIILVSGSFYEAQKALKHKVHFDQQSAFTQRFQIKAVPSFITQHGDRLRIDEIAL